MMVIEMRDSAYDKAFELLDEALHHNKETKMVLCALEDAMYDCYETESKDEGEYDDENVGDENEVNFRRRSSMSRGMRYRGDGDYRRSTYRSMRSNGMRR